MISVLIATIPGRERLLERALRSVEAQTLQPYEVIVEQDLYFTGAMNARNRAIRRCSGDYLAVLDDDDEFLPNHLEELYGAAKANSADLVYSDFITTGLTEDGMSPYGHVYTYTRRGLDFDAEILQKTNYIPITALYNTALVKSLGGWSYPPMRPRWEDWGLYLKLLEAGAKFHYHQTETWIWHYHGLQTGGNRR